VLPVLLLKLRRRGFTLKKILKGNLSKTLQNYRWVDISMEAKRELTASRVDICVEAVYKVGLPNVPLIQKCHLHSMYCTSN